MPEVQSCARAEYCTLAPSRGAPLQAQRWTRSLGSPSPSILPPCRPEFPAERETEAKKGLYAWQLGCPQREAGAGARTRVLGPSRVSAW